MKSKKLKSKNLKGTTKDKENDIKNNNNNKEKNINKSGFYNKQISNGSDNDNGGGGCGGGGDDDDDNNNNINNKSDDIIVTPGTRIGDEESHIAGRGCYTRDGYIYSSLVGRVISVMNYKNVIKNEGMENVGKIANENDNQKQSSNVKVLIEVLPLTKKDSMITPRQGSIVIARVTKITQTFASVDILCVDQSVLHMPVPGMIRVQDVRKTEIDKISMIECFRPGDLVKAVVISLGDSRSYYLSTAQNELGVIYARSITGGIMVPVSWKEMQCLKTGQRELRKVAKII